jgi:hypothetical protein
MAAGTSHGYTLVGVDCALDEQRLGLARGRLDENGKLKVERVTLGTAGESAAASVSAWIDGGDAPFVIALDAPLGWPSRLAPSLVPHRAGEPLAPAPEVLFRRETDRVLHKQLGKWPPEVGADRIARTGWAALSLLAEIRSIASRPVPLAWRQGPGGESGAIEVFPAATLLARKLGGSGYRAKTSAGRRARAELLQRLAAEAEIAVAAEVMIEDPNQFDAMLGVLAGADFARGLCVEPTNLALAQQEGFIWFRSSGQRLLSYGTDGRDTMDIGRKAD